MPREEEETMRMVVVTVALLGATLLAGTAEAQDKASAEFKDTTGKTVGEAVLEQRDGAVQITATFTGLPPGRHGFHVHEVGTCEPPFESAGEHFNPTGKQHGKDNPKGPHLGDLPNLDVPDTGRAKVQVTVKNASLARGDHRMLDGDGAALVVHARPDDYRTDPAGQAGDRLACAVIRR